LGRGHARSACATGPRACATRREFPTGREPTSEIVSLQALRYSQEKERRMRHLIIALAVVTGLAVSPREAAAQRAGGQPGGAPPAGPQPAPEPPRTVPPPIVYPLPPLMTPPAGGLPPLVPETPRFHTEPSRHQFGIPSYGFPFYTPYVFGDSAAAPAAPATPARPATGWLRLAVTPVNAQVFIDSRFVGTVEEIDARRTLALDAGPHRLELRAPQFRTVAVDMRIAPSETLTYRAALEPELPAPPPPRTTPRPAASPSPMYVIPNCYMGNVPPRASRLPSGCDIKRLEVLTVASR
jgi:hypothetical protein